MSSGSSANSFVKYVSLQSAVGCFAKHQQNPADLGAIKRKDHYHLVKMTAMEQILYFEVYQIIMSKNIKFGGKLKVADLVKMSRDDRLHAAITRSTSREDALMSCCSDMRASFLTGNTPAPVEKSESKDKPRKNEKLARELPTVEPIPQGPPISAEAMCDLIIKGKEKEHESTRNALFLALQEAYAYRNREPEETAEENPHLTTFIDNITNDRMGDKKTTDYIKDLLRRAEKDPIEPIQLLSASKTTSTLTGESDE